MKHILFLFLLFAHVATLQAQEAAASADRGKEPHEEIEKLDQGSNLERKQYKEISEKNRERITNGIKLLTIISANFGEELPESKAGLEKIRADYQVALRYYYRNAYILSGKSIQKVEKDLSDLLSKFAKLYDAKTQALLSECADSITQAEQKQLIVDSQESGKGPQGTFLDLTESAHKLKIAYYQLSLALEMVRDNRFYESLVHYRISKDYGIKILTDLKESEADKKAISDKYAKDLADNRNLISGTSAPAK
jgi:hypothetical protein